MLLVTGDVILDHHIYEGRRATPQAPSGGGSHHQVVPGGAMLTYQLLDALTSHGVQFGLKQQTSDQLRTWPGQFHACALWKLVPDGTRPDDKSRWALEGRLGYGEPSALGTYPGERAPHLDAAPSRVLVIDDGGLGFRDHPDCWPAWLKQDQKPDELEWLILKVSRPLASGMLWQHLMRDSWRERLIVLVNADQLRSGGVRVAGGLSWESSVDDIVDGLESSQALSDLGRCRHLIVAMRSDAALWLDQPTDGSPARCQLTFDRTLCEGEWEDQSKYRDAFGGLSMLTASLAWAVSQWAIDSAAKSAPRPALDLTAALAAGLSTGRFLRLAGHGPAGSEPGLPFLEAASHLKKEFVECVCDLNFPYASAEVRGRGGVCRIGAAPVQRGAWTILGQVSPWHAANGRTSYGPARRVALLGPSQLRGVPCASFGQLQTFDRREIDSLRTLRQLMLMYRDGAERKQPLNLAVFGAPGSGKSFGLKQIAQGIFGEKTPILEFNLSQFNDPADLIGAFHQVRDHALSGATPVAFWDEFDTEQLKWLRYFLAPMQDGKFQEGQITHFVGKSVFVFAGGINTSFQEFCSPRDPAAFRSQKGPDFISRLAGYLDIAGPNPRDTEDREFPVRRAMVLRIALKLGDKPLEIEPGLLTALLALGRYRNGARSLEKLVTYMRDRGGLPLRSSYLPPDDILALHVEDVHEFHDLTIRYAGLYARAVQLARKVHSDYIAGLSEELRKTRPNAKPWNDLTPDIRESNIAAALRMPEILGLAGLTLEPGTGTSPEIDEILRRNLALLAEAEHGGWEEQKRIDGWIFSPNRDDTARRHDLLIPYQRLEDEIKEFDRRTVLRYQEYAGAAGFRIIESPGSGTETTSARARESSSE